MATELDQRLSAAACRNRDALRSFIVRRISANGWPIHSRPLYRLLRRRGLDLGATRSYDPSLEQLSALMHRIVRRSFRIERMLGVDNAYHHTLHNLEVLQRLLLLEWPAEPAIPRRFLGAAERTCTSLEAIAPTLAELMARLLDLGLPSWQLARDLLAAAGHDYGHVGGTDRRGANGEPLPLTHEETAERHVAKLGIDAGMPPALVIESLAGIRATTFHVRPGRPRIEADNEFERKLTLADIAGWVLVPDQWLVHVSMSVLAEAITHRVEPPARDLRGFFANELEFLRFSRDRRLAAVPAGGRLWADVMRRRIALIERILARDDLLAPLAKRGFPMLRRIAEELVAAGDLRTWLSGQELDPRLIELFGEFLR